MIMNSAVPARLRSALLLTLCGGWLSRAHHHEEVSLPMVGKSILTAWLTVDNLFVIKANFGPASTYSCTHVLLGFTHA